MHGEPVPDWQASIAAAKRALNKQAAWRLGRVSKRVHVAAHKLLGGPVCGLLFKRIPQDWLEKGRVPFHCFSEQTFLAAERGIECGRRNDSGAELRRVIWGEAQVVDAIECEGGRAVAFCADQADPAAAAALVVDVQKRFGRLDVLVNNAGVAIQGRIDDSEADQAALERQFAVNILSVAAAVRAAAPLLTDGGRIISIGSVFGACSPWQGIGGYSATKAALGGYTRGWSRDLGPRGITVNLLQPGAINSELNPETADHAASLVAMTSLGRYGQPDAIAAVVAFLAGPGASYITGAIIDVDGSHFA